MFKQIHVNSYVKQDGTEVKEHYRTIDSSGSSFTENSNPEKGLIIEENPQKPDTLLSKILHTNQSIAGTTPVLKGEVSMLEIPIPKLDNILGAVLGTVEIVASVGVALLPVAAELYAAASKNNKENINQLKPKLDNGIKQLDTEVQQMKQNLDNSAKELANTKNQQEYTKKYNAYTEANKHYHNAQDFVNKLKVYAHNNDFKEITNEIKHFTSKTKEINSIQNTTFVKNLDSISQSNTKKSNIINILKNDNIKNNLDKFLPVAGTNLNNSLNNLEYAQKDGFSEILNSRLEIKNSDLNKLMDKIKIPETARGIVYYSDSIQSKQLYNSPEIRNFINNNFEDLITNNTQKFYNIEFFQKSIYTRAGLDNFAGLQHCILYNPQITPDGYFEGLIIDYYDFEKRTGKDIFNIINNWGYTMQQNGQLENIFFIYIINEKLW